MIHTPPAVTIPDDLAVEANNPQNTEVTCIFAAEDDASGNITLEEYGATIIQDDIGNQHYNFLWFEYNRQKDEFLNSNFA